MVLHTAFPARVWITKDMCRCILGQRDGYTSSPIFALVYRDDPRRKISQSSLVLVGSLEAESLLSAVG